MKTFIEKFNENTGEVYSYLKLTKIDVNVKNKSVTVNFIYPEALKNEVLNHSGEIEQAARLALESSLKVDIKLIVSHFDRNFFLESFKNYLKTHPAIASSITDEDILVCDTIGNYSVTLMLSPHILSYCTEKNIFAEIKEHINLNYCDNIALELKQKQDVDVDKIFDSINDSEPHFVLDDANGRFIQVQNVDALIGSIIYDKAIYIEDALKPNPSLVVCGKIVSLDECSRKDSDKKYYRMILDDTTGKLNCLYFPSKYTVDKITLLKQGKEVIMRGSLDEDKFNQGSLVYMVKSISYCTLPKDFKPNLRRRQIDSEYRTVFPTPYISLKQSSLFETATKKLPASFLLNKRFCVFDIETTGFTPQDSMIIELAAVKIIDGVFSEVFSTFVNPQIPISERTTSLTGITDKDVINAPTIAQVLPDFYKFANGTILVGQNARQFDMLFIRHFAKMQDIYFDNEIMDTLELSRKYFPGLKNYQLQTLAEYFKVSLEGAHRAINDTIATAEIFAKIAEKLA